MEEYYRGSPSRCEEIGEENWKDMLGESPAFREKAKAKGLNGHIRHWNYLVETFEEAGIPIKDVTPREDGLSCRTEEIKKYLADHPYIKRYVILDDCFSDRYESDKEVQSHLVFVDALKGLQRADCVAACEIMNRQ